MELRSAVGSSSRSPFLQPDCSTPDGRNCDDFVTAQFGQDTGAD